MRTACLWLAILLLRAICAFAEETPLPLIHAHAHNDYVHTHPLFDALSHGIASVEADIYLIDGQLLVAHDQKYVDPRKTLQSLYLEPLRARAKKFGGRIYPAGDPTFYLLIDTKTDAGGTWQVLRKVLDDYADILTRFTGTNVEQKAVTVVLTGHRPRQQLPNESTRLAGLDGQMPDIDEPNTNGIFLWMSENWKSFFTWNGRGNIPPLEKSRIQEIVAKSHDRNMKVRFWNAPQSKKFWTELRTDGVDLINADDLAGVERFLRQEANPPK